MNKLNKLYTFLKKKYVIGGIILLLIVAFFVFRNGGEEKQIVKAERKDVVQEILVTGKTKAQNEVELSFDTSGRVRSANVKVGDKIPKGTVIAELDSSEVAANLSKQRAILAAETANLEQVMQNAPASVNEAKQNLSSAIRKAYSDADNAVRNKADQFFKTPRTNPIFEVTFTDGNFVHYFAVPTELQQEINAERRQVESILNVWQKDMTILNTSNSESYADRVISNMNTISAFLDKVALAINSFTPAEYAYDTTVAGYKTSINTARSDVSTSRSAVISAKESISSQPIIGQSGQLSSVAIQQAKVNEARSSVSAIEATISKTRIVAPFDGTVTKQDAKVGQTVVSGDPLISLISESNMYIEANVSEINIGKVSPGNSATIEFDAYPNEYFNGTVVFVDPGETLVDEVVNYKVRVELENTDPTVTSKIKSGLTANIRITSSKKENVISIPVYAVIEENGKFYVNKSTNGNVTKVEVTKGLQGSDGNVEIVSGINEGDEVLLQ